MPFQYANEANPRAHYEGTGAEIAETLDRVDVLVAGLGTGGTLMGAGARLRETFPDVVVAAAEPLPGEAVMGLRSLADGYVPPILDVERLDRKLLVSNEESVRALRELLDTEGIFGGVSAGAVAHVARRLAGGARGRASSSASSPTAAGSTSPPTSGTPTTWRSRWSEPSGGSPGEAVRAELRAHSEEEAPNEACGLVVLKDGVAERYVRGRNAAASPYRFELEVPPETWFLEDEGYELAVFHSHLSSPPRPSRTDVENIGLWQGKPYLILSLGSDTLAGWTIHDDRIEPLAVTP